MRCRSSHNLKHPATLSCGRSLRHTVRARTVDQLQPAVDKGRALLSGTLAAGLLLTGQIIDPLEASAARTGGRAGTSTFKSRRAASSSTRVESYSSTTIITAPPVVASPIIASPMIAPAPVVGISIVPVIPIPVPIFNPFAHAAAEPVQAPTAETLAATEAAAAAASAAAAAASAAAAAAATAVAAK